jgi:osmotically-inducible protein OsmY
LLGTAGWQYQRQEAEHICASIHGVMTVNNEISLAPAPSDADSAGTGAHLG